MNQSAQCRPGVTTLKRVAIRWTAFTLALAACWALPGKAAETEDRLHAGLLFDEFDLTLSLGTRTEAAGPFYYAQQGETERVWGIPPLMYRAWDPATESEEYSFLYPVLSYARFGEQYRWQLFQLFSFAGGPTQTEPERHRVTLFPLYFHQRSSDPAENYTTYGPFYGHMKNRLWRDEIDFVMFPLYSRTRKADVVTRNYVYPFFHLREGNKLEGWQFWPLLGHEHKDLTTRTNGFGDVQPISGHDRWFALWPIYFDQHNGLGTDNVEHHQGVLPLYSYLRSPGRDSTTVIWPFFSKVDDRQKGYEEWQTPWPFVVFARGPGKVTDRVWPVFGHSQNTNQETGFFLWPVYRYGHIHSAPLDRQRDRVLLFLYSNTRERNTQTDRFRWRRDLWPFYHHTREMDGSTRLQVLGLLEPFMPNNRKIEREYSQVWSLWRSEKNAVTGDFSQSLLWNLYRRQKQGETKTLSYFFGLYQSRTEQGAKHRKLFFIPLDRRSPAPAAASSAAGEDR